MSPGSADERKSPFVRSDREAGTRDRCAIVGIGTTDYSFNSGRSTLTLAAQAASAAIADAGLEAADIDGIVRCEMDEALHADLAATLGLPNVRFWAAGSWAGAAPCGMVGLAVNAICSGQAEPCPGFPVAQRAIRAQVRPGMVQRAIRRGRGHLP